MGNLFCGDMSDKFSEFSALVDFIDLEIHILILSLGGNVEIQTACSAPLLLGCYVDSYLEMNPTDQNGSRST